MKNFKLSQAVFEVSQGSKEVKYKLVKTAISSVLVFGSIFGLTGCSGNNDKPEEIQTPTEDVLEPVVPEKTPEELEIEQLQDFQVVDKDYNNEILESYNKIMGYEYTVTRGADQHTEIWVISPDDQEGMARLQKDGDNYRLSRRLILPCCFINSEYVGRWLKKCPIEDGNKDKDYYMAVDDKYKYISDEDLDIIFEGEETETNLTFDESHSKNKVKTR